MLSIYTPQATNRIRYTFDLIFKEVLGIDYKQYNNVEEFLAQPSPKFSYDKQIIPEVLSFGAVYLLFEKGIKEQSLEFTDYEGTKVFFQLENEEHCLPFDPFAASFFLVSRYEEYLPHHKDQFNRFPAKESVAFKHNFLKTPLVNYYIQIIKSKLAEHFPEIIFSPKPFNYIPTYDVDSAFAYLNKGVIRNTGGLMKSLFQLELFDFWERFSVLIKQKKDPFDSYDWLETLHQKHQLKPVYFFLVGDYDEFDKNISINMVEYRTLIKSIADYADVGIHPSYASNANTGKLAKEIRNLSDVLKREIKKSRQHFLKLEIPRTYQNLMEYDIREDYTMGYASHPGFRASICHPFYFYNLETENKTMLKVFPFAIMDATLNYYLQLSPEDVEEEVYPVIDEIKKMNGTCITLWHNSSLSEEREWTGWQVVYKQLVEYILS